MKPSLLRSYLFISLGITLLFIALGVLTMDLIHRANDNRIQPFEDNLPTFFAKIIEHSKGENRKKILDDLRELRFPVSLWLLDESGKVLVSNNDQEIPFDFKTTRLPIKH